MRSARQLVYAAKERVFLVCGTYNATIGLASIV